MNRGEGGLNLVVAGGKGGEQPCHGALTTPSGAPVCSVGDVTGHDGDAAAMISSATSCRDVRWATSRARLPSLVASAKHSPTWGA